MKCDCGHVSKNRIQIKIYKEDKRTFKATMCYGCFFDFKNTTVKNLGKEEREENDNKRGNYEK